VELNKIHGLHKHLLLDSCFFFRYVLVIFCVHWPLSHAISFPCISWTYLPHFNLLLAILYLHPELNYCYCYCCICCFWQYVESSWLTMSTVLQQICEVTAWSGICRRTLCAGNQGRRFRHQWAVWTYSLQCYKHASWQYVLTGCFSPVLLKHSLYWPAPYILFLITFSTIFKKTPLY
jgi:hypothetical protein